MNRDALLVYLQDLRDLEAAKYQIEKMRKNNLAVNKSATGKIQSEINAINTANYMEKPYWPDFDDIFVGFFVGFFVGGMLGLFLTMLEKSPQRVFFGAFNIFFDALDIQSDIFKRIMILVLSGLIGGFWY